MNNHSPWRAQRVEPFDPGKCRKTFVRPDVGVFVNRKPLRGLSLLAMMLLSLESHSRAASPALQPWATNNHSTDVAKSHVEEVGTGVHQYTVLQGGTMDGRNCRSPMGCGIEREGAYVQTWESNRAVRMENVGQTDVINPWVSNGRNFRTMQEIVASATTPDMTEAEKAYALWFQEIQYRHHCPADNKEVLDPVKVFNVYGYNTCGNDSIALATLWRAAGLKAAPARALGHCISQAFHDGGWHFYDGDMHSVYLLRDNATVASEQDIVRDHDLIKRTHSKGILTPDSPLDGQGMCAMYFYEGEISGERGAKTATTMNMVLRPGEALVWRWGHLDPPKYHGAPQPVYPSTICNGLWEYQPDFLTPTWRKGAASVENIDLEANELASTEGKKGTIVWTVRAPYVFVGGRIEAEGTGAKFFVSADGRVWESVTDNFDKLFPTNGPARYEYQLKCELDGPARLRHLAITNDLQMAPMALPELAVGANTLTYSDQSTGERKVRITHEWVERSASRAPVAPQTAVYPPAGGEANGSDIVFRWNAAEDPDGDAIRDYQFELSNRADMRWPLSLCFYKLISKTADGKQKSKSGINAQYTLPQPGLLTPDKVYHWRVRAMDEKGVWGNWSKTWSFTARGMAQPVNVTLEYDSAESTGVLRWNANAVGQRPAKYRVYGSDEKGFSIADSSYQGMVGITKEEMAEWSLRFPANFIAETTATELAVLGRGVSLPAANKTFYRVVAVDEQGKRSGPSDYASAPRPVIYSTPVGTANAGREYRYALRATASLGDLSMRMKNGKEARGYFDIEKPKFAIERGPSWLRIDDNTGVLSGTPDMPGKNEVVVTARIEREVRELDEPTLKWGNEKLLSVAKKQVGSATQKFVIDVR